MKIDYIFNETIKLHKKFPEIRIASSLSLIEVLYVLYYKILKKDDIVIFSKGHGSIAVYPILADLGYFEKKELQNIGRNFLTSIPDPSIPGIETINGSLGHGLGVGIGRALGIKRKGLNSTVFVICGDGELFEGSMWEAIMLAPNLVDNLVLIVDYNKTSMLDRIESYATLEPLAEKFNSFNWNTIEVDGHNIEKLEEAFNRVKGLTAIIAHTKKGRGIEELEKSPISHILSLKDINA